MWIITLRYQINENMLELREVIMKSHFTLFEIIRVLNNFLNSPISSIKFYCLFKNCWAIFNPSFENTNLLVKLLFFCFFTSLFKRKNRHFFNSNFRDKVFNLFADFYLFNSLIWLHEVSIYI